RNRSVNRPPPTTFPLRGKGPGANPEACFLLHKHGIVKTCAWDQGRKLWLARRSFNGYSQRIVLQATSLRLALACLTGAFLASCATQPTHPTANRNSAKSHRMNVRTTAYCVHERGGGGRRNAVGEYLSGRIVR